MPTSNERVDWRALCLKLRDAVQAEGQAIQWGAGVKRARRELGAVWKEVEQAEKSPVETAGDDASDAAKWRAFRNCARIRVLGSAGFLHRENQYRFLTLEAWTQHDAQSSAEALDMLEEFVAVAQRCSPEEPARELSASEAASFDKTLARSPRRVAAVRGEPAPEFGASSKAPEVTPGLCCCRWDASFEAILHRDRTCSVHGDVAAQENGTTELSK